MRVTNPRTIRSSAPVDDRVSVGDGVSFHLLKGSIQSRVTDEHNHVRDGRIEKIIRLVGPMS
jgi:hypothetical protein